MKTFFRLSLAQKNHPNLLYLPQMNNNVNFLYLNMWKIRLDFYKKKCCFKAVSITNLNATSMAMSLELPLDLSVVVLEA